MRPVPSGTYSGQKYFNPRTPCGVRRPLDDLSKYHQRISIHAPLAGCDVSVKRYITKIQISIHAPLAGCDRPVSSPLHCQKSFQSTHPLRGATTPCRRRLGTSWNFNPRTPCGVRLITYFHPIPHGPFQSTHPLRGATPCPADPDAEAEPFQSTHPLRGATRSKDPALLTTVYFNPRTPCGVRLRQR